MTTRLFVLIHFCFVLLYYSILQSDDSAEEQRTEQLVANINTTMRAHRLCDWPYRRLADMTLSTARHYHDRVLPSNGTALERPGRARFPYRRYTSSCSGTVQSAVGPASASAPACRIQQASRNTSSEMIACSAARHDRPFTADTVPALKG